MLQAGPSPLTIHDYHKQAWARRVADVSPLRSLSRLTWLLLVRCQALLDLSPLAQLGAEVQALERDAEVNVVGAVAVWSMLVKLQGVRTTQVSASAEDPGVKLPPSKPCSSLVRLLRSRDAEKCLHRYAPATRPYLSRVIQHVWHCY